MNKILSVLFVALLMVGCEESSTPSDPSDPVDSPKAIDLDDKETRDKIIAEAIDGNKLKKGGRGQERKLLYAPNEQTPYTGWVKSMHDNGKLLGLGQLKDGKQDGWMLTWRKNGQKWREANFKDGKRDGLATEWDENGQKKREETYKDDKLVTAVAWKPNGEKCPVTNVKDGNGIWVMYNKNGTEQYRLNYKDGEELPPNP
jgi:antitoxin component YwqK of YwqJK toxin-antitoxin module